MAITAACFVGLILLVMCCCKLYAKKRKHSFMEDEAIYDRVDGANPPKQSKRF